MTHVEAPAVARRRLRLALRHAREASGLTQAQVARALEWSLSKVNRIEAGEVTVSATDLQAMLRLFDIVDPDAVARMVTDARASRRRGWWDESRYREHLTPPTMQLLQFENDASTIRAFHPTLMPGVLQTSPYAQVVLNMWGELSDEDRAVRLEVRMRRREQVFGRPDPPDYLLILDESVLLREFGGPTVMAEQLRDLVEMAREPHITVRVVPLADAAVITVLGQFTVFDLGDDQNAVLYRESAMQDEIVHSLSSVQRHRQTFDQIWDKALSEDASTRMMEARAAVMLSALDQPTRH